MAPSGVMNDLVDSLQVSAAVAGQLITIGAVVLALSAPLLAAWVAGSDRRRLLTLWLLWYAVGHVIAALSPNFTVLAIVRTVTLLGAAVFTPQAGAAIAVMTPPHARGHAITFVFLGWAVASVLGLPLHAYVAETFGWRVALGGVAGLSALAAWWVWHVMPDGVRPAPLSRAQWRTVFTDPVLMAVVMVTALAGAGTVHAVLVHGALLSSGARRDTGTDRRPVPGVRHRGPGQQRGRHARHRPPRRGALVALLLAGMALSFVLWPFAGTVATMALSHRAMVDRLLRRTVVTARALDVAGATAGAGVDGAQLGGHLRRPGGGRGHRRRDAGGQRLLASGLGRAGVGGGGDRAEPVGGVAATQTCVGWRAARGLSVVPEVAGVAGNVEPELRAPRSKTELFTAFTWLALQGFGGVLAVAQRELVERLRWLSKEQFVELLSLSQVLPGPNIINLSADVRRPPFRLARRAGGGGRHAGRAAA